MSTILLENSLYCFDMIELESGDILSLCGNFNGPWYRGRLSLYPRAGATRIIKGVPYRKVSYETGYQIPALRKLLDLPGEQHFLVHRTQITRIYKASGAFSGLSDENSEKCQLFIDFLYDSCRLGKNRHGLTGSGALRSILPTSDFDWIVYSRDPNPVEACILSNDIFKRELTFNMEHVYRKYAVFTKLSHKDLDALFSDRWKYFWFQGIHVSMSFVDPTLRADNLLGSFRLGDRVTLQGVIIDSVGCYHMPHIIPVDCGSKNYLIFTWLFLYNGAFKTGNAIEFSGRECVAGDEKYILVEEPQDYIRKLADQ